MTSHHLHNSVWWDKEQQKSLGLVFTPEWCAELMVKRTIDKVGTLCDLACGSGILLETSCRHLKDISDLSARYIVENLIYGVDICPQNIETTKQVLSKFVENNGENMDDISFKLFVGDALSISLGKKFNYVLGNPPYVRTQEMAEQQKTQLLEDYRVVCQGNFNLYFAFFVKGVEVLEQGGRLAYITPNSYMNSIAARKLRRYISTETTLNEIIDFDTKYVFERAKTFTCITILDRKFPTQSAKMKYTLHSPSKSIEYSMDILQQDKWLFKNSSSCNEGVRLKDICDIKTGIATLKDKLYVVHTNNAGIVLAKHNGASYEIERGITRKYVKISSYSDERDIKDNSLRIIFPYEADTKGLRPLSEQDLRTKYPLCYEYLVSIRTLLDERSTKTTPWYAYGRHQSLNLKGQRLYIKTFDSRPNFMMDEDEDTLFSNGYALFLKNNRYTMKQIQETLNTERMNTYIKENSQYMNGGYYCFQKQFIENFVVFEKACEKIV